MAGTRSGRIGTVALDLGDGACWLSLGLPTAEGFAERFPAAARDGARAFHGLAAGPFAGGDRVTYVLVEGKPDGGSVDMLATVSVVRGSREGARVVGMGDADPRATQGRRIDALARHLGIDAPSFVPGAPSRPAAPDGPATKAALAGLGSLLAEYDAPDDQAASPRP